MNIELPNGENYLPKNLLELNSDDEERAYLPKGLLENNKNNKNNTRTVFSPVSQLRANARNFVPASATATAPPPASSWASVVSGKKRKSRKARKASRKASRKARKTNRH